MRHSIQDYGRKINSRLSWLNVSSLLITALFMLILTIFLYIKKESEDIPVSYISSREGLAIGNDANPKEARPFASLQGKTYTFSWCNGSSNISVKNKIYFADEEQAKGTGRTLSKLCQK